MGTLSACYGSPLASQMQSKPTCIQTNKIAHHPLGALRRCWHWGRRWKRLVKELSPRERRGVCRVFPTPCLPLLPLDPPTPQKLGHLHVGSRAPPALAPLSWKKWVCIIFRISMTPGPRQASRLGAKWVRTKEWRGRIPDAWTGA